MGYKEKRLKRKAGIAFTKMPETFASKKFFYFKFIPNRLKKPVRIVLYIGFELL